MKFVGALLNAKLLTTKIITVICKDLLEKETDGTRYRLIGIGVSDLTDPDKADPPDLVDLPSRKRALAEGAIDRLREKFGKNAVETGYTFGKGRNAHPPDDVDA